MEFPILYEDADIVAIAKPAGMFVHQDASHTSSTVADWFAEAYPASRGVGEPHLLQDGTVIPRPGVVHRLDADTSGVLLLAKTSEAHAFLKSAFQNHEVQKTYLAFVYGVLKEEKGVINFPIGRSRKDFRLRSAQPKAKGVLREAITRYERIGEDVGGAHTFLRVMPETGRTHQIRVHLKAIHHPIVCDPLYAPNHTCDLGFNRLGLHAYEVSLTLPSGVPAKITAPIPADLVEATKRFPNTEGLVASR